MFRRTINANVDTDVGAEIARLKSAAQAAGLSAADIEIVSASAAATLSDVVARGREMAGAGTTIAVERTLKGEGYEIYLAFCAGGRQSLWDNIVGAIRGR
jgi:hypothetical protein